MADEIVSGALKQLGELMFKLGDGEIKLLTGVETEDLEDVSYEIDDVIDEWNYIIRKEENEGINWLTRVRYFIPLACFCCNQFYVRHETERTNWLTRICSFIPSYSSCFDQFYVRRHIATKVKKLSERLDLIDRNKNQFSFSNSSGVASTSQEWERVQSTSFIDESEVFDRASDKNILVNQLLSKNSQEEENATQIISKNSQEEENATQIISIIGTGGIGKTTLAKLAYNDEKVAFHFEKRVWVCVSYPFDEIRVAKAIVESLESNSPNLQELDSLLKRIEESTSKKRFLLVFDDVWTEDQTKWEPFKITLGRGGRGSTILLTTRSERVAIVAGATCKIRLDELSPYGSWSLFCRVAFSGRTETERGRLESIGWKIASKCKGLPLAIKTIGSLLRFKSTVKEWQKVLDSNIWELEAAEFELFPLLYLSYNELSSPMRRCFSYCAVFPKDELINVHDLIKIWMAQGYLDSSGSENEMELKGWEYFKNLSMRSLFQDFNITGRTISCKMHDIVHDFAQFLTKRECLIFEGVRKERFCENARHLTWLGSRETIDTLSNCNIRQLRSFLAWNLNPEILTTRLLSSLKLIRVLKLCGCRLKELPTEMGNLIHLRYLDLSYNVQLLELSITVYDLFNLQTLNLKGCDLLLFLLPGIEKLTKLRHLTCGILKFPVGIGELACLQTLHPFSIAKGCNKLGYLKNLNQLQGSLHIMIMVYLDDVTDAENADLKSKEHIQELTLEFYYSVKEAVMEALKPPPNLQLLTINGYGESRLPMWMTSLGYLTELNLITCTNLTVLPPLGILPSLEKLALRGVGQLKKVGPDFLGIRESLFSLPTGFPKLTELIFEHCEEWEEWEDIAPEEEDDIVPLMPGLRMLSIRTCPKLQALPHHLLRKVPLLECIELDGYEYDPSTILSSYLQAGQSYPISSRFGIDDSPRTRSWLDDSPRTRSSTSSDKWVFRHFLV